MKMKNKKNIKSFEQFNENSNSELSKDTSSSISDDSFGLKMGKYTLYNYDDVPLPIDITEIDTNEVEFESWYSSGNKHEWEEKFIGTEMEGLVYDPFQGWFDLEDIEKVDGDKIYLTKR
jgi:hypothetical protein